MIEFDIKNNWKKIIGWSIVIVLLYIWNNYILDSSVFKIIMMIICIPLGLFIFFILAISIIKYTFDFLREHNIL